MKAVVKSTATHKGVALSKVRELRKLYTEMQGLFLAALEKAMRMGEILSEIKDELPHGQFGVWIDSAGLPFKARTARLYMKIYDRREEISAAGISGVAEAQKFLSSGGVDPDEKRQRIAVLDIGNSSNEAASGPTEVLQNDEIVVVKLTVREQQIVAAIVAAGGDRQSAEYGIKAEKLRAKKERERRQKEREQQQSAQIQPDSHFKQLDVPPNVYRRFSRLAKKTGRPIAELLEEAADALARYRRTK